MARRERVSARVVWLEWLQAVRLEPVAVAVLESELRRCVAAFVERGWSAAFALAAVRRLLACAGDAAA